MPAIALRAVSDKTPASKMTHRHRVISSSCCDLSAEVARGQFSSRLYLQLSGFTINVPSLAQRKEDIPAFVNMMIPQYNTALAKSTVGMEPDAMELMVEFEWPLNCYRMELLGAKVHPVKSGTRTLKDAVNEAMREWVSRVDDTLYVLGSVMGPHPYPMIVRDFQSVIGREARQQILEKEGRLPDAVLACVGGGSNAMGIFHEFIPDESVQLIGCEAAGKGVDTAMNAATMTCGSEGVFHGMKSYFCQNEFGQIAPVYSISAGLDYPGVGPEHAYLHDIGRAQYVPVTDDQAVDAFEYIARTEGIICAIESAHAVAYAMELAPKMDKDQIMIVNLSGRGDKDVAAIARYRGIDLHE